MVAATIVAEITILEGLRDVVVGDQFVWRGSSAEHIAIWHFRMVFIVASDACKRLTDSAVLANEHGTQYLLQ
jgi:hypothetical protein